MEIQGLLHCHSSYSYDAKLSLRELRELCIQNGIHFACMTEHTDELTKERAEEFVRECEALSDESFRFIPGFEVPYKNAHILMIGAREFVVNYAPTLPVLDEWIKKAQFVVLAHPVRNKFIAEDALAERLDGIEVWNQQYEGKRVPRPRSIRLFETLRKRKSTLVATGGIDLHRDEHMGSPVVTLSVDAPNEAAIIEKLKLGIFAVSSPHARFFGLLTNADELMRKHRFESIISVAVIGAGKFTNKTLAYLGLTLPASLKRAVRRSL